MEKRAWKNLDFLAQDIAKDEYTTHHKFGVLSQSGFRDIRILNFLKLWQFEPGPPEAGWDR